MPANISFIKITRPPLYEENIPESMKAKNRWVLWAYVQRPGSEQKTKPPFRPDGELAKPTDAKDWSSFEEVMAAYHSNPQFMGIGYVTGQDDDLVAWDLDHVLDAASLRFTEKLAEEIVRDLNSFTEITPSGEGLHVWVRGKVPKDGRKQGKFECYQNERYITVTGNHWPASPPEIRAVDCDRLWRKVFGDEQAPEVREVLADPVGEKLWHGEWKQIPADPPELDGKPNYRYASQSDADLALCRLLLIATDGDVARTDALFRQSGLMREKWDSAARSGDGSYGQGTLRIALENFERSYHWSDLGNAKRLARHCSSLARFSNGKWYMWDGRRLEEDARRRIVNSATDVIEMIRREAKAVKDEESRDKMLSFALKSESKRSIEAMISLASAQPNIAILPDELDARDDLFCVPNGTIENGILREHRFEDLLTKMSRIQFNENASAPRWDKFVEEILPDEDLRRYIQRAIGYSMTGHVTEQVVFIAYGTGANGKSKFFEAISKVLGDYATILSTEAVIASRNEMHPTYVADLKGARFALAAELPEGKRLNEDLIKRLTGEGTLKARRMHEDSFVFRATAKLWIMSNHEPQIRGTDHAIWRRIRKLPFTVTIPESRQIKNLSDILAVEYEGILAWCVRGMREWLECGLMTPEAVLKATEEYRQEQDVIGNFLMENFDHEAGAKVYHVDIYSRYSAWADSNREFIVSSKELARKLRERGLQSANGSGNKLYWQGLKFRPGTRPRDNNGGF